MDPEKRRQRYKRLLEISKPETVSEFQAKAKSLAREIIETEVMEKEASI